MADSGNNYTDEDVLEPLDDLRDDSLWVESEQDGTAKFILQEAHTQAQTTLSLISDHLEELKLLQTMGSISLRNLQEETLLLIKKRSATRVFLQLVRNRQSRQDRTRVRNAYDAIHQHRYKTKADGLEPSEFDLKLWELLPDE